jgi:hypothetical protein
VAHQAAGRAPPPMRMKSAELRIACWRAEQSQSPSNQVNRDIIAARLPGEQSEKMEAVDVPTAQICR